MKTVIFLSKLSGNNIYCGDCERELLEQIYVLSYVRNGRIYKGYYCADCFNSADLQTCINDLRQDKTVSDVQIYITNYTNL